LKIIQKLLSLNSVKFIHTYEGDLVKRLFLLLIIALPLFAQAGLNSEINAVFNDKTGMITGTAIFTADDQKEHSLNIDGITVEGHSEESVKFAGKIELKFTAKPRWGGHGEFVYGYWHPSAETSVNYNVKITAPKEFIPVTEANSVVRKDNGENTEYKIEVPSGVQDLSLTVSNRWKAVEDKYNNIDIIAYFSEENQPYAKRYIVKVKEYLRLYENMLTPYPYKRFVIVDSFLPAGHANPTYTALFSRIIKLPFIADTSLGHEVLHQWFGCSVQSDYDKGNWLEGLTTYLADHYYEEQKGLGHVYRKNALLRYSAYAGSEKTKSIREFKFKTDRLSEAVGYDKTLMLFHMIRKKTGNDAFFGALRLMMKKYENKTVGWDELIQLFEHTSGKQLNDFINRWVDMKSMPRFWPSGPVIRMENGGYKMMFVVQQITGPYEFDLPVLVRSHNGSKKYTFHVKEKHHKLFIETDDEPLEVVFDADYDLMRIPTKPETYASISRLLGSKKIIIAYNPDEKKIYEPVIKYFKRYKAVMKTYDELSANDMNDASVVFLGIDNETVKRYFDRMVKDNYGFVIKMFKNTFNRMLVTSVINSRNAEESKMAVHKLSHYGKYSELGINQGVVSNKIIGKSSTGILRKIRSRKQGFKISEVLEMKDIISQIENNRIIYVGETHTNYAHHINQMEIIKGLKAKGHDVAIGMEMFQEKFQKYVDQYLAGEISEKELLVKTEYFDRWGYDYNLYRPILKYAKKNGISVVALNASSEAIESIRNNGIEKMDKSLKNKIPETMDYTDERYLVRVHKVFRMHPGKRKFNNFLEAQLLWDETMAANIDNYMKKNPYKKMVIIAGNGHIETKNGIPARAFRRNGLAYATIMNDADMNKGVADYVLYPDPIEGKSSPKLGVYLDEEFKIVKFAEDSPAKKAGAKINDKILSINGRVVKKLSDLKLELFFSEGKNVDLMVKGKGKSRAITVSFEQKKFHH